MISRLTLILLLLGCLSWIGAQDRGSIGGTVTDPSGAMVPAAKVNIVQSGTNANWSVSTNEVGRFYVPNLPLGQYRVSVQKEGFNTATNEAIEIRSQTNVNVDFKIQTGTVSQSVEVAAAGVLLDTATATSTHGLSTKLIDELPLISFGEHSNIASYLRYLPGTDSSSQVSPTMNGSQGLTGEVFVDGAPASDGVIRGSIWENGAAVQHYGEFNVVSDSFSAEYGRTGAWFYNVSVKSGTNDLHGSLYDNFVNTALNARDFFQPTRQIYHQNNGGLTVGGPVYIPKVYNGHNRTFFFFGEDLFFSVGAQLGNLLTIPPAAMRLGDFSNYRGAAGVIPIFDPDSTNAGVRTQFPGNIIPANRISKVSQNMMALMPAPDLPTQSANWHNRTGANPKFNNYTETAKVDHSFSDREKVYVSYTDESRPRSIAGVGWGADSPLEGLQLQPLKSRTGRISADSIFRPTLINHVTVGIDRYLNPAFSNTAGQNWDSKLGITGMPFDIGMFPGIIFSGGTDAPLGMGSTQYSHLGAGRYSFNDSLTWVKGQHFIKAGVNFWNEYRNDNAKQWASGQWTFNNQTTSQLNVPQSSQWGSSFASFLLGDSQQAYQKGYTSLSSRLPYQALFFQDEWHIAKKLSLSLGLRWENNSPPYDKYDRLSIFSPTTPNAAAGNIPGALVFAGTGAGTFNGRTTVQPWHKGFAPRVGYSYQITQKLVMRSSVGIFYSAPALNALTFQGQAAQSTIQSVDGFAPAYQWDKPFPSYSTQPTLDPTQLNGQTIHWYAPDYARAGQTLSWTSGFQYQLSSNTLLAATYIGHHGTHLEASYLGNTDVLNPSYLSLGSLLAQPIDSSAAIAAGIRSPWPGFSSFSLNTVGQALRQYPQYLDVYNLGAKVGVDRYNSLQITLTRRLSRGLTLVSSYAWSKNMTNVPSVSGDVKGAQTPNNAQNPYNRAGEVSPGEGTRPVDFKVSVTYDLPFGSGKAFLNKKGFINGVIGGWQIVGFVERASGVALSVTASNNLANLGLLSKRADLVPGQPLRLVTSSGDFDPGRGDRFLNKAAFAAPAVYALGNTARTLDWLRGWPLAQESASIRKNFALHERAAVKVGMDLDNPFNHVRWGNPVTNINASNFGAVTSTSPGRRIQLTAAVSF